MKNSLSSIVYSIALFLTFMTNSNVAAKNSEQLGLVPTSIDASTNTINSCDDNTLARLRTNSTLGLLGSPKISKKTVPK